MNGYYQKNKERLLARQKERRELGLLKQENFITCAFRNAKRRAKEKGLEFNIIREDIIIPEYCPILGIKIERGYKTKIWNSPTLDRVDNSRGYVKGNVRVISHRANANKGNMTVQQVKNLLAYMEGKL